MVRRDSQPQFPPGPEGDQAKALIRESIESERRAEIVRLTQRLEELAVLLQQQQTTAIATAAAEAAAKTAAAIIEQLALAPPGLLPVSTQSHQWDIPEWHSYPTFRKWVIDRFRIGQSKKVLADLNGTSSKSITRAMESYHLNTRLWPPTLWPEREPSAKRRRNAAIAEVRHLGGLAAAVLFFGGTLDLLDGRADGVIRFCLERAGHLIQRL